MGGGGGYFFRLLARPRGEETGTGRGARGRRSRAGPARVPAIAARAHLTGTSLMPEKERKGSVSAMVVVAFEARGAVCDDGSRPLTAWPCPKVPARFPSPVWHFSGASR